MTPRTLIVCTVLTLAACLLLAGTASGQTTVNPRYVEFDVSADHSIVVVGTPVVTGYRLNFYAPGAPAPFQQSDLGKPTPTGVRVTLDLQTVFLGLPTGEYNARVEAYGPGGVGVSDTPVPFGRLGSPRAAANVAVRQ